MASAVRLLGRGLVPLVVVAVLLGAGWWVVGEHGLSGPAAAPPPTVPTGTATVSRRDVATRQVLTGTLGYPDSYPVVNELTGVLTWLPAVGSEVRRGQRLYEVDGKPVLLMYGGRPAWRDLALGVPDGPDVRQLEADLLALGFDPNRTITVDGHFGLSTAAAVRRWQRQLGLPQTGMVEHGRVVFEPGPIRVGGGPDPVGAPAPPGGTVLTGTGLVPVITVPLDPDSQADVRPGLRVSVTLPRGSDTGRVTEVGQVAAAPADGGSGGARRGAGGGAGGGSDGGAAGQVPTVPATVRLDHPGRATGFDQASVQVAISQQVHRQVLTVPITALLVGPGGRYQVELAGSARRVPVSLGLFDDLDGVVEVSGPGLTAGTVVEVPAS